MMPNTEALAPGPSLQQPPRAPDLESLVLSCNKDGMDNLRSGDLKLAVEQLKYAEAILIASQRQSSKNDPLLAVTFNNLGCLYKRSGRTHAALSYLRRALRIEVAHKADGLTIAGTHLNICSILSKLGKHDKAVQHALCALELLTHNAASLGPNSSSDDYSVLAICYHNVAVEREFLGEWDQAATAYKQGHQVALRCLGREHALTKALLASCDSVILKKHEARPGSMKRIMGPPGGAGGKRELSPGGVSSGSETEQELQRPRTAQGLPGERQQQQPRGTVKLPPLPDAAGRPQSAAGTTVAVPSPKTPPPGQQQRRSAQQDEIYVEMRMRPYGANAGPGGAGVGGAGDELSKAWAADEESRWQEFASSVLTTSPTPSGWGSGYGTRNATPTPEPFQRPKAPAGPPPGGKLASRPGSAPEAQQMMRPGSSASTAPTEAPLRQPSPTPGAGPTIQEQEEQEDQPVGSVPLTHVQYAQPGVGNSSADFFGTAAHMTSTTAEAVQLAPPTAMEVLQMFEQVGGSGGRFSGANGEDALPEWVGLNQILEKQNAIWSRRGSVEPQLVMEQIDLEREKNRNRASMKPSQNDYRPNRLLHGSTRTSLVIRRMSGAYNTQTFYRDEVLAKEQRSARVTTESRITSKAAQKLAAERIQRIFRQWRTYLLDNREWITTTRICAILIQGTWRSYHVRRVKLDAAANRIQPVVRGFLVRSVCRKHATAIQIQRHFKGVLTRMRMKRMHQAAVEVQRTARGRIGRRRCAAFWQLLTRTAIIFQRFVRMMIAKRKHQEEIIAKREHDIMIRACVDLQRLFRGAKGRQYCDQRRIQYRQKLRKVFAATKIGSLSRMRKAQIRVSGIRKERLFTMNEAATTIRKIYLAFIMRRHYLALKTKFTENVEAILVMQRYFRGFLVRIRMWREAIQAEEQLWGAVEIQRLWRGFLGRLRHEEKYEEVWTREVASTVLQRWIRGWMARVRVTRTKRALARKEFERARKRFLAAQRIQALMRGKLVRIVMSEYRRRVVQASTKIQALFRGFTLRAKLWKQLLHVKAVLLQAHARGFVVRRRRLRLICCVLTIERKWRFWRTRHPTVRRKLMEAREKRKASATVIQKHYQDHAMAVTVSESGVFGKDKRQASNTYTMGQESLKLAQAQGSNTENRAVARASLGDIFKRVSMDQS